MAAQGDAAAPTPDSSSTAGLHDLCLVEAYGTWADRPVFAFHPRFVEEKPQVDPYFAALQVPHTGTYGDEYEMSSPSLVVLTTPSAPTVRLSEQVQAALRPHTPSSTTVMVLVHTSLPRRQCGHLTCTNTDEVSLSFHLPLLGGSALNWAFDYSLFMTMMGLGHWGVRPVHQDCGEVGRGVPLGNAETREVTVHGGRLSPANCQVQYDHTGDVASLTSVCIVPPEHTQHLPSYLAPESPGSSVALVTLHLIPVHAKAQQQVTDHMQACQSKHPASEGDAAPLLQAFFAEEEALKGLPSGFAQAAAVARELLWGGRPAQSGPEEDQS